MEIPDKDKYEDVTLVIVHDHPRILLGMKKRGFGAGRWNGFGGKLHEGETILEAAHREVEEEAGIQCKKLTQVGKLYFSFVDDTKPSCCHVFKVKDWEGDPIETEEMKPAWFHVDDTPYDEMWPDDEYWLPHFLNEIEFEGRAVFDENGAMVEWEIDLSQ